jgi:hypothetical protein
MSGATAQHPACWLEKSLPEAEVLSISACRAVCFATLLVRYEQCQTSLLSASRCTQSATPELLLLCRWMAADLYLREVDILRFEVSLEAGLTRTGYVGQHMQGGGAHMPAGTATVRSQSLEQACAQLLLGCALSTTHASMAHVCLCLLVCAPSAVHEPVQ